MDLTIPYVKEIPFKTKIKEICSISLEHTIKSEDGELTGHFIVSGEYKTHELSVNKEPFSYELPFNIALSDLVDEDTVEFNITDFYYEIVGDASLKVNIECSVTGTKLEIEEKREEVFETVIETTNDLNDLVDNSILEEVEEKLLEDDKNRNDENKMEIEEEKEKRKDEEEMIIEEEVKPERLEEENSVDILKSVEGKDEEFITYQIHIVKENETIETIINKYNTSMNSLNELNNLDNVKTGDKIIIPDEKNA